MNPKNVSIKRIYKKNELIGGSIYLIDEQIDTIRGINNTKKIPVLARF